MVCCPEYKVEMADKPDRDALSIGWPDKVPELSDAKVNAPDAGTIPDRVSLGTVTERPDAAMVDWPEILATTNGPDAIWVTPESGLTGWPDSWPEYTNTLWPEFKEALTKPPDKADITLPENNSIFCPDRLPE